MGKSIFGKPLELVAPKSLVINITLTTLGIKRFTVIFCYSGSNWQRCLKGLLSPSRIDRILFGLPREKVLFTTIKIAQRPNE